MPGHSCFGLGIQDGELLVEAVAHKLERQENHVLKMDWVIRAIRKRASESETTD